MKAKAIAHSNIALVKYWGKRDTKLNLPAVGSISITLEALSTTTSVEFSPDLKHDIFFLNNIQIDGREQARVQKYMDLIRQRSNIEYHTVIKSENNFPTAAGLASSASAFAALALAGTTAAGLKISLKDLSILARIGSGSAARSIFGGFVEMHKGLYKNGSDAYAEPLADEKYWDLRVLIAVTSESKKKTGSTDGMTLSQKNSPYYRNWVATAPKDLSDMRVAIKNKDFQKLGEISEFSCLKMHALAMATNPGLIYWNGTTVDGMHLIRELRGQGTEVYFTIDAGPQLKAVCQPKDEERIKEVLEKLPGVQKVIITKIGGPAQLLKDVE
jgi:diphosphomevalonate decarboxylase